MSSGDGKNKKKSIFQRINNITAPSLEAKDETTQPAKEIAKNEESFFEQDKRKRNEAETELIKLEGQRRRQDISERKIYAKRIYKLINAWLLGIFTVIFLQGVSIETPLFYWGELKDASQRKEIVKVDFTLSEAILMALIGGTTINVIGIFIVVTNYLFPKKEQDSSK